MHGVAYARLGLKCLLLHTLERIIVLSRKLDASCHVSMLHLSHIFGISLASDSGAFYRYAVLAVWFDSC